MNALASRTFVTRRSLLTHRACAAALLLGAVCLGTAGSAFAWGRTGHAVVADIAQAHLTPAAAAQVRQLLSVEGTTHLADISLWADQAKADHLPGSPSHTIRLPLDDNAPVPEHPCPGKFCADDALTLYGAVLADTSRPLAEREVALKYIVHLVGDLHQPLHDVNNTGQMDVVFNGEIRSMHQVWDDGIIDAHGGTHDQIAYALLAKEKGVPSGGAPMDWAKEGRRIVQENILKDVPTHAKEPFALPADYAKTEWPVVELRLTEGGLRLARLLNSLLK